MTIQTHIATLRVALNVLETTPTGEKQREVGNIIAETTENLQNAITEEIKAARAEGLIA